MNTNITNRLILGSMLLLGAGLANADSRWFSDEQVEQGKKVFKENCSTCHGDKAQGTINWKVAGADGKYPPPPLNGTAHAWHHSMDALRRTVREGGIPLGGVMPPFKDKLDAQQIDAAIAYFQSQWNDKIYANWSSRNPVPTKTTAPIKKADPDGGGDNKNVQQSTPQKMGKPALATSYLGKIVPQEDIGTPEKTAIPSILQVKLGNDYAYVSEDGRYLYSGELIDLKTRKNLTRERKAKDTVALINAFPEKNKITFPAKGAEKASITVFTDTSCPYCKKLHQEVPDLQKAGVTVKYIAFPRSGLQGAAYETMKSVWCAQDRQKALDMTKGNIAGSAEKKSCEASSAVDEGYALGKRIGITGTPAIVLPNGELIEGYVPQKQLLGRLIINQK